MRMTPGKKREPSPRKLLNRAIGAAGEDAAEAWLRREGFRILERNHRNPAGEIDIIAEHRGVVVFIEVKTRSPRAWQPPEAAVDADKRRRLRGAAKWYLGQYRNPSPCRFDIVSIDLDGADRVVEIRHFSAAFEAEDDGR